MKKRARNAFRIDIFFLLALSLAILAVSAPSRGQTPLLLGVHPYLPCHQIKEKFTPLAVYLSREMDRPVRIRIGSSYQAHINAIGRDQLDIAYIGPAEYLLMEKKYGPKPLIARQVTYGHPTFKGIIFVRDDSHVTSLADLGKGEFAFVGTNSTMGYLIPLIMLKKENLPLIAGHHYKFLKTHEDVVLGVLSGDFEAGAVKEETYEKFSAQGLRILATTPSVTEHLFITRSSLDQSVITRLQKALIKLGNNDAGQKILHAIKASITGFAPVTEDDFMSLKQMLAQLQPEVEIQ